MKYVLYIESKTEEIQHVRDKVRLLLELWHIREREIEQADVALQELLKRMIEASLEDKLKIEVHKLFGDCVIRISGRGKPIREEDIPIGISIPELSEVDSEQESIIRSIIVKSYGRKVSVHHRKGLNTASLLVETSKQRALRRTICALLGGVVFGGFILSLSPSSATLLADNLFSPIYTMFLDAIKMMAAPLVFFSIASAFASNRDIQSMGKLSLKMMIGFLLTSLVSIAIAIAGFYIHPIGDPSLASMVSDSANAITTTASTTTISLKNTIINIIPTDMLSPFLKSDMLEVLFLAILMGFGVSKLGASAGPITHGIELLNELFTKTTKIVIKFMPLSIFCAMANMIIKTDMTSLISVGQWMLTTVCCYALMLVFYAVLIPVFTRLSPLTFYKKYAPVMLNAFVICSGNAVMPFNMEICRTKLGISPKAYSFAIPFGTVMNKNGGCIVLMISTLFMAHIFGVPIDASMIVSLIVMNYILSIAAPAIPGSLLICIATILPMMGIPANAISIIIGIYAIDSMIQTVLNVTGTAVCTLIAAKSENLIDMKIWNEE